MKFFSYLILCLIFSISAHAGRVLDLGKIEIKGKARGPEMQIIETGRIEKSSAARITLRELKNLETDILNFSNKNPVIQSKKETP